MKTLLLIFLCATAYSQPYLGVGIGTGVDVIAGYKYDRISAQAAYKKHFTSAVKPMGGLFSLGYDIEVDDYTVQPFAGVAVTQRTRALYGAEFGRQFNMGKLFINVNNIGSNIGMKIFLQ